MTGIKIMGVVKAGVVSAVAAADSYFTRVALLLNGSGVAGTSNDIFVDSSVNNYTTTTSYEPKQGSFSPYAPAGYSNYFNGSNYTSTNSLTPLGAGDWTIECFINTNDQKIDTGYFQLSGAAGGFQAGAAWINSVAVATNNNMLRIYVNSGAYNSTAMEIKPYTWYHIALVKYNNAIRVYVDGVLDTTFGVEGAIPDTNNYTGSSIVIGAAYSASYASNTYISNFRITGNAVYTGTFTPPSSTLQSSSDTRLLVANSRSFADLSPNNLTLARAGSGFIRVSANTPFHAAAEYLPTTNGGSAHFNISSSISAPAPAVTFGTGDFTIESWVMHTYDYGTYIDLFRATNTGSVTIRFGDSGLGFKLQVGVNSSSFSTLWSTNFTQSSKIGSWYHIAFTRENGVCRLFIDGKQMSLNNGVNPSTYPYTSFVDNTNVSNPGAGIFGASVAGYMSDMRIVKGTALYTADFALPTAPLAPVPNTSLLLNCAPAGIVDRTAKEDFNTSGNMQISGNQSKFGETSIYFDGSSYMTSAIASDQYLFPSNCDYTVECWYYANTAANFTLVDNTGAGGTMQVSRVDGIWNHGGQTWNYTPPNGQWIHLAFSRNAGVLRLFSNGVLVQSQPNTAVIGSVSNPLVIGRRIDGNYPFNGYLDDLRITKGVGRYTAAFTPPATSFPVR